MTGDGPWVGTDVETEVRVLLSNQQACSSACQFLDAGHEKCWLYNSDIKFVYLADDGTVVEAAPFYARCPSCLNGAGTVPFGGAL